jgi:hypothetical protein
MDPQDRDTGLETAYHACKREIEKHRKAIERMSGHAARSTRATANAIEHRYALIADLELAREALIEAGAFNRRDRIVAALENQR